MKKNRTNYYAYTMDMDTAACKVVTPSYRELPADVPLTPCSGRTELCDSVLNDRYVSLSSGQEDSGSFKVTRKNQYEEALYTFFCHSFFFFSPIVRILITRDAACLTK